MTTNKAQEKVEVELDIFPFVIANDSETTSAMRKWVINLLASAERDAVERCVETIESFFSEFKDCMAKDCHHSERDNLIREIIEAIQAGKDEG